MRTLVIGDIHGHILALDRLLEVVAPKGDDLFIALGDYIDRGPDSKAVLDRLIALHETGRLIPLLGNHEEMLLDSAVEPERLGYGLWRSCGGNQTLASYGTVRGTVADLKLIPPAHWSFLREACLDYYETATHIFAHANLDPQLPLDRQPSSMLRWEKLIDPPRHISGKILVCGHTRQLSGWPLVHDSVICIDTSVYSRGWLTCLEVETGRFWQANMLGEIRESNLQVLSISEGKSVIEELEGLDESK